MKPLLISIAVLPLVAGCLGTAPKAPKNWTVEWTGPSAKSAAEAPAGAPSVKLLQLDVLAPYGGSRLAVLRADGSIAFDSFNSVAAQPASLLKGAAYDVVESCGAFSRVVRPNSSATSDLVMEIEVTRLALDCRAEGGRVASAAVTLSLVGNRSVVSSSRGSAAAPVRDGDFSSAFSAAFADAMRSALGGLSAR